MRYAITICYKGTNYHGWQRQLNAHSVQQELEDKLSTLCAKKLILIGCGRTDSGVHATHFVAHFNYIGDLPDRLAFRLNGMLPKDIAILHIKVVSDEFHARFSATRRDYRYYIHFIKNPFKEGNSCFQYHYPNFELMNDAAKLLVGKREFASFCKGPAPSNSYWCEVYEAYWEFNSQGAVFHISADRFLRNMVRAIVGTLLKLGNGQINLEAFKEILESKNRSDAGNSVHACGLFLEKVSYPEEFGIGGNRKSTSLSLLKPRF
jgi:tRNA pseudouridine38-40 synthase